MLFGLWLIVWVLTFFCFLPLCDIKIARAYGRFFNMKIYTKAWRRAFYVGGAITVVLSIIILFF